MCLASLEKMRLEAVCVCVDHHHHSSHRTLQKPISKTIPSPHCWFSIIHSPIYLTWLPPITGSANGIQYNSLLPKKCSNKNMRETNSTMLIHPSTLQGTNISHLTLSSIIMVQSKTTRKFLGNDHDTGDTPQKFHWTMMGGEGIQPLLKKYAQVKLDHETPRVRVKIAHIFKTAT